MFNVYYSNDPEVLAKIGGMLLDLPLKTKDVSGNADKAIRSPFYREKMIVQNPGMYTYVSQVWAETSGILSQVEQSAVWGFIWNIGSCLLEELRNQQIARKAARDVYSKEALRWNILGLINDKSFVQNKKFCDINSYINAGKNENDREIRAYQISGALAEMYDRYQVFRVDWIESWKKGDFDTWLNDIVKSIKVRSDKLQNIRNNSNNIENTSAEISLNDIVLKYRWEADLWQLISANLQKSSSDLAVADRSYVLIALKNKLNTGLSSEEIDKLPKRIFVYGVSSFSPDVFEIMVLLGKYIDVHLMFLDPCSVYWGDLVSTNLETVKKIRKLVTSSSFNENIRNKISDKNIVADACNACQPLWECSEDKSKKITDIFNSVDGSRMTGNPLLLSYGRLGRDNLAIMVDLVSSYAETEESSEITAFVESKDTSGLLSLIKHDLYTGIDYPDQVQSKKIPRRSVDFDKETLTVTSCATRLREVQVLYDRILAKFDADKDHTLRPRDIIVLAPNISIYAPFIRGVFSAGNEMLNANNKQEIKFAICDSSIAESNPFLGALKKLFHVCDECWTGREILDLFSVQEIRNKFVPDGDSMTDLNTLFNQENIVFGLDKSDVDGIAGGKDLPFTVSNGVDRMLLGSMMPYEGQTSAVWDASLEGDTEELISQFSIFVNCLETLRKKLRSMFLNKDGKILSPLEWFDFIRKDMVLPFFQLEDKSLEVLNYVQQSFMDLDRSVELLKEKPDFNISMVRNFFDDIMGGDDSFSPFLRDSINFCTFMPMRSVPFKHMFMLGMNDGEFPKNNNEFSFDLMNETYRKGDRNSRDDDRYMFMESLLSAEESLAISYVGQNISNGTELNPSIVISELENYVVSSVIPKDMNNEENEKNIISEVRKQFIYKAPVNVFDKECYQKEDSRCPEKINRFWSYQSQWFTENIELSQKQSQKCLGEGYFMAGRLKPDENGTINIDLDDFVNFWTDTCRYFYRKKIFIKNNYDKEAPEAETFSISLSQKNGLIKDIFEGDNKTYSIDNYKTALAEKGIDDHSKLLQEKGILPYGALGVTPAKEILESVINLKMNLDNIEQEENRHPLDIELNLEDIIDYPGTICACCKENTDAFQEIEKAKSFSKDNNQEESNGVGNNLDLDSILDKYNTQLKKVTVKIRGNIQNVYGKNKFIILDKNYFNSLKNSFFKTVYYSFVKFLIAECTMPKLEWNNISSAALFMDNKKNTIQGVRIFNKSENDPEKDLKQLISLYLFGNVHALLCPEKPSSNSDNYSVKSNYVKEKDLIYKKMKDEDIPFISVMTNARKLINNYVALKEVKASSKTTKKDPDIKEKECKDVLAECLGENN